VNWCYIMANRNGLIEYPDGSKRWYHNDLYHRVDGPAIEYANGKKYWYCDGKLHRTDGPAIESPNGTKYWYANDVQYTFSEWIKLSTLTKNEISELVLYYG